MSRFRLLLLIYSVLFWALAMATMGDYGLTWDEPTRWRSGDEKLDYFIELWQADEKAEVARGAPADVYPGLYDIPLAIARRSIGVDDVILTRVWTAVFAYVLALVPVLMTRLLLNSLKGSRAAGRLPEGVRDLAPFAAGGSILLMPELNGHLLMNPKDVPFAATFAAGVCVLLWIMRGLPSLGWGRALAFGLAAGVAMSTRPPGAALFAFAGLFVSAWVWIALRERDVRERLRLLGRLALKFGFSLLVALLLVLVFWPRSHAGLFELFSASVEGVADLKQFSSGQPVLFGGQFYDAGDLPWYYSLWMFMIKMPEWVLLLLLAALAAVLAEREALLSRLARGDRFSWGIALLVAAVVIPWAYVILSGTAIHNGFRHMFYVLPFVAVWAAMGLVWVLERVWSVPRWRIGAIGLFGAACAFSLINIVSLYPYQYIYYNAFVGGTAGAYGRYETDYWVSGAMAGAEALNEFFAAIGGDRAKVAVLGPYPVYRYYLNERIEIVRSIEEADFYIGKPLPSIVQRGEVIYDVSRSGVPISTVVLFRRR